MAVLKGSVPIGEQFVFNLETNPTTGYEWRVKSDGGLSYKSWYEPDDNPGCLDGVGGTTFYAVGSDVPGRHIFVLQSERSPDEIGDTFEVDLYVFPQCDSLYQQTWEGFNLSVVLSEEPGEPWEVAHDDGIECEAGIDEQNRPVLNLKAGPPGEYRLLLSRSEKMLALNLKVEPVENRKKVETVVGKTVSLTMDANITTGFRWVVVDDGGLICEDRYESDPNPGYLCGVGGKHIFEMTARSPGTYILHAVYMRPWEEQGINSLEVVLTATEPAGNGTKTAALPEPMTVKGETKVRKEYVLKLKSNPTTGFKWKVVDDGGLHVKESYVSDTRNKSICGAGGTTIYKLAADTPGEYRFVAQYGRDWEDSPIKSIVLLLTVKPGFRLFR